MTCVYLERSRLTTLFMKIMTHLKLRFKCVIIFIKLVYIYMIADMKKTNITTYMKGIKTCAVLGKLSDLWNVYILALWVYYWGPPILNFMNSKNSGWQRSLFCLHVWAHTFLVKLLVRLIKPIGLQVLKTLNHAIPFWICWIDICF